MKPILALLLTATTATANPYCTARADLAEALATKYSEQPVGGGMQGPDGLIEVWASAEGATWTILMSRADGMACVVATGTDWFSEKPKPAGRLN